MDLLEEIQLSVIQDPHGNEIFGYEDWSIGDIDALFHQLFPKLFEFLDSVQPPSTNNSKVLEVTYLWKLLYKHDRKLHEFPLCILTGVDLKVRSVPNSRGRQYSHAFIGEIIAAIPENVLLLTSHFLSLSGYPMSVPIYPVLYDVYSKWGEGGGEVAGPSKRLDGLEGRATKRLRISQCENDFCDKHNLSNIIPFRCSSQIPVSRKGGYIRPARFAWDKRYYQRERRVIRRTRYYWCTSPYESRGKQCQSDRCRRADRTRRRPSASGNRPGEQY
jgi:hypothetical protein